MNIVKPILRLASGPTLLTKRVRSPEQETGQNNKQTPRKKVIKPNVSPEIIQTRPQKIERIATFQCFQTRPQSPDPQNRQLKQSFIRRLHQKYDMSWRPYYWSTKEILGEGSYGIVYGGVRVRNGFSEPIAVKIMNLKRLQETKQILPVLNERSVMTLALKSHNLLRQYDTRIDQKQGQVQIFLEKCDGDIEQYMEQSGKMNGLSEGQVREILAQILQGMKVLIDNDYIHRDIKPANILFKKLSSGKEVFKLADFGFATVVEASCGGRLKECVGSPFYESPQILNGQPYTSKSDIWSIGMTIYELLFGIGEMPWPARSIDGLLHEIQSNPRLQLPVETKITQEMADFLRQCLTPSEKHRIDWPEIFNHPLATKNLRRDSQILRKIDNDHLLQQPICFQVLAMIQNEVRKKKLPYREFLQRLDLDSSGTVSLDELYYFFHQQRIPTTYKKMRDFFEAFQAEETRIPITLLERVLSQERYWRPHCKAERILQDLSNTVPNECLYGLFNEIAWDEQESITYKPFERYFKEQFPGLKKKEIASIFDYIDSDKSKSISFAEMYVALYGKGYISSMREQLMQQIVDDFDLQLRLSAIGEEEDRWPSVIAALTDAEFHHLEIDLLITSMKRRGIQHFQEYISNQALKISQ